MNHPTCPQAEFLLPGGVFDRNFTSLGLPAGFAAGKGTNLADLADSGSH